MKKIIKLGRSGFSLIELMFGISILLVVVIASSLSLINSMFLNESSRNIVTAANDMQYALEQIKAQGFSNIPNYISSYAPGLFTNLPNENITFPNPVYTLTLDTLTVQITWNERATTKTFSITTCFAQ